MTSAAYLERGFVRISGVLDDGDLAMLRDQWARLWRVVDEEHAAVQRRGHAVSGTTPDRIDPAYILSPQLEALCNDARLKDIAAGLLGAPVVRFKDKLISKAPGTHGYGLHQDWPYWSSYGVPAKFMTTLMIAIDPCDAGNGALEVFPTADGVLPAPENDDGRDADPAVVDLSRGTIVPLAPGDVLALHALAPHRSAPNLSQRGRRSYFVTYVTEDYADAAKRYETDRLKKLALM